MSNTLLIIDMQYEFSESAEKVVGPVCDAVRAAIEAEQTIILVEYGCDFLHDEEDTRDNCDCITYTEITDLLTHYPNVVYVTKDSDDGGKEVFEAVEHFSPVVDVCGVNTNACVRGTVETLSDLVPDSEFVLQLNACNSTWWGQDEGAHKWVDQLRNVRRAA